MGDSAGRVPGRDGLRGVRVGEASNIGPPDDELAPTEDDSMGIVSALEFDLTQLDSDHLDSGSDTEVKLSHIPARMRTYLETGG